MSSNSLRSSKSSRAISDLPSYNSDSSVGAKLRRLRLEENVLINLLHSTASKEPNNESKVSLHSSGIDFNNFANKLKGNLNELKKIFEDIKDISNEDNLKEMDVDDIRNDVMDLDSKIGSLKTYLNAELISLRSNQEILEQQIEECAAIPKSVRRRGSGTQINKQFVVSPVKNLMTTPLKCMEVQQFQDFMANSSNRYGGWNEYNHLIFVNVWNKTFGENLSVTTVEDGIESSDQFPLFLNEVVQKVLGSHEEDIIEHTKWYSKYLFLKESQQKALLKWKTAKNIIRKGKRESSTAKRWSIGPVQKSDNESTPGNSYEEEIHASSEEPETFIKYIFRNKQNVEQYDKAKSLLSNYEKLNYLKPTKQWTSRSSDDNSTDTTQITYCNVEVIPKMATPNWRLGI